MNISKEFQSQITKISFEKRMKICEEESKKITTPIKPIIQTETIFWSNYELEYVALHSVLQKKSLYENYDSNKWFFDSVRLIRNNNFLGEINEITALKFISDKQISPQISYLILYYRYNFIFNYKNEQIDLREAFIKHFKLEYKWFVYFAMLTTTFLSNQTNLKLNDLKDRLSKINFTVLKNISKTREEFIMEQNKMYGNASRNIFSDYNLLLTYPIIKQGKEYYVPYIPYIPYACSESLMYQLTKNNNHLKSKIGKEVVEDYLYHLAINSRVTNMFTVKKEFKYDKDNKLSPDIIIYNNDSVLFVESKFTSQSLLYRSGDNLSTEEYQKRFIGYYEQIIKKFISLRNGKMNDHIKIDKLNRINAYIIIFDNFIVDVPDNLLESLVKKYKSKFKDLSVEYIKKNIEIKPLIYFENMLTNSDLDIFEILQSTDSYKKGNSKDIFPDLFKFIDDISKQIEVDGLKLFKGK